MITEIRIQQEDFDVSREYEQLRQTSDNIGAIVCFSGLVRQFQAQDNQQPLQYLALQHYPGMTEKVLADIVTEAGERWSVEAITVIHRVGKLHPSDQIVFVGIAGQHRKEAFEAGEFIMDHLKTRATFWKSVNDGTQTNWVENKQSDIDAATKWNRQ